MVKAWKETVVIPTYEVGEPEKNPIFLENRVYQGSSGVVYPYPVIESVADDKKDKEYEAIYLENEYIKVMILPEIGGRVQMAWDKIANRHFIYYNSVIKPALVGLTGPWISGGIEINWPQHHRPSTFMRIDASIENLADGGITVWVGERERMFHQKGMAGYTLRPGCAYLEVRGVCYNPTEVPQTFLWWANPAVKVNDEYQSVFPPDVNAVYDHGKRAVSTFPIAIGEYYKMDYSAGVDISNYRNIKVPTSYMICDSRFDFEGGYEHDTKGGMLHVANHHVSPGKKQWTWGNGDFGWAWDRNLTDEDGPYIEIMAGVYAENQPDFTWLQPYEEKRFVQYFMPYRELGIVKNASKDLLINVEHENGALHVKLFATSRQTLSVILLDEDGNILSSQKVNVSPESIFDDSISCFGKDYRTLKVKIIRAGHCVLDWQHITNDTKPVPDPAKPALPPSEIASCEQLYLTGLHLEQYRHATYNPIDYYEEALRRDPSDIRNNNALGLLYIRKGRFSKAEPFLRKAVATLQDRNKNPYDGEPIYNLALCLKYQGRLEEAYELFYKSTWNGAWQDAGFLACAQISTLQGRFEDALEEIDLSLNRNWHNHKGRALKIAILRKIGRISEALALIDDSLKIDPFNYGAMFEKHMLSNDDEVLPTMFELMHGDPNNFDELALDYCGAGLWVEATELWQHAVTLKACTPMTRYYLAWAMRCCGLKVADKALRKAATISPDFCFPNRLEAIIALESAMKHQPEDAHAPYFLGNLFYDKRQYDLAIRYWELSDSLCGDFPTVKRNLALAYYNKLKDTDKALAYMEKAFELDPTDSRILMELDQLWKVTQKPHAERLAFLDRYPELVEKRDDLVLERITLLNMVGRHAEAEATVDGRRFHPWEGGEGKVPAQYQLARVCQAVEAMDAGDHRKAIGKLEECLIYPHNLGEGRLHNAQENDFFYMLGCAYAASGDDKKAIEMWEKGVKAPAEPAAALYYNDAKPDKIFYSGLCLQKLGRNEEASERFQKLLNYGEGHLEDQVVMDYFAVSLPDLLIWDGDLNLRNKVHCLFMMALGHWGLGDETGSKALVEEASRLDSNHLGIIEFKKIVKI